MSGDATPDRPGDAFIALAPLAALGALDGLERGAFEAHARGCPTCRHEIHAYERVVHRLPLALPSVRPPSSLRARVLAGAGLRPARVVPFPPRGVSRPTLTTGLALAAALVMGVGLSVVVVQREAARDALQTARLQSAASRRASLDAQARLAGLRAELAQAGRKLERERELRVALVQGDARLARLAGLPAAPPGARARVVWSPRERQALLVVSGLPATPAGQAYEAWLLDAAGRPRPAGAFHVDAHGHALLRLDGIDDPGRMRRVAVTLEAQPGRPAPGGPLLLLGALS